MYALVAGVLLLTVASFAQPTRVQQEAFIKRVNHFRASAVPPATHMRTMFWHVALAEQASQDVTCNNTKRSSFYDFPEGIGNIHWIPPSTSTPLSALVDDLGERQRSNFDLESGRCLPEGGCGEYLQLVAAATWAVGCARTLCADNTVHWLCYFAPKFNTAAVLYQPLDTGECKVPADICSQLDRSCGSVLQCGQVTTCGAYLPFPHCSPLYWEEDFETKKNEAMEAVSTSEGDIIQQLTYGGDPQEQQEGNYIFQEQGVQALTINNYERFGLCQNITTVDQQYITNNSNPNLQACEPTHTISVYNNTNITPQGTTLLLTVCSSMNIAFYNKLTLTDTDMFLYGGVYIIGPKEDTKRVNNTRFFVPNDVGQLIINSEVHLYRDVGIMGVVNGASNTHQHLKLVAPAELILHKDAVLTIGVPAATFGDVTIRLSENSTLLLINGNQEIVAPQQPNEARMNEKGEPAIPLCDQSYNNQSKQIVWRKTTIVGDAGNTNDNTDNGDEHRSGIIKIKNCIVECIECNISVQSVYIGGTSAAQQTIHVLDAIHSHITPNNVIPQDEQNMIIGVVLDESVIEARHNTRGGVVSQTTSSELDEDGVLWNTVFVIQHAATGTSAVVPPKQPHFEGNIEVLKDAQLVIDLFGTPSLSSPKPQITMSDTLRVHRGAQLLLMNAAIPQTASNNHTPLLIGDVIIEGGGELLIHIRDDLILHYSVPDATIDDQKFSVLRATTIHLGLDINDIKVECVPCSYDWLPTVTVERSGSSAEMFVSFHRLMSGFSSSEQILVNTSIVTTVGSASVTITEDQLIKEITSWLKIPKSAVEVTTFGANINNMHLILPTTTSGEVADNEAAEHITLSAIIVFQERSKARANALGRLFINTVTTNNANLLLVASNDTDDIDPSTIKIHNTTITGASFWATNPVDQLNGPPTAVILLVGIGVGCVVVLIVVGLLLGRHLVSVQRAVEFNEKLGAGPNAGESHQYSGYTHSSIPAVPATPTRHMQQGPEGVYSTY